MSQTQRKTRASKTTVEELNEVRSGVYVGDFVNERGVRRENVVLIPSKIFSSSEDMVYRSADGYVGKYLLSAARENSEFSDELYDAVNERREYLEGKLEVSEEEQKLREALDVTSDETTQASLVQRLQELEEDNVDRQAVQKAVRRLEEVEVEL
jgi:hypothetical protein